MDSEGRTDRRTTAFTCAGLFLLTLAVFWGVHAFAFVNYDDDVYITGNRLVRAGLSWDGVKTAFTRGHNAGWNPLALLSHMLDVELFGLRPGGHHVVNLAWHLVNTLLLFAVLRAATGAHWASAFAAALFAIHPLHVEPVAWIASRKDVLSTFFWVLTMGAYYWYTRRPSARRYAVLAASFSLGLMAKPMLVTLPCVLLLMDWWPLDRVSREGGAVRAWGRLALEKLPLFALTAVACLVTYFAQRSGGAVRTLDEFPLGQRLANALVSYVVYLSKVFVPTGLAVFYPHPGDALPLWQAAAALAFLCAVTGGVWAIRKRAPYLMMGWLWYLGTLVPVIGIVQIGSFARADRFTYIPLVGLFIAVAWSLRGLAPRFGAKALGAVACASLLALAGAGRVQLGYWRDSVALFERAIEVTEGNAIARNNLAVSLLQRDDAERARELLEEAVALRPEYGDAHNNLGIALDKLGLGTQARRAYENALAVDPGHADARANLANACLAAGEVAASEAHYAAVLAAAPEHAAANQGMAALLVRRGAWPEAAEHYAVVVRQQPDNVDALYGLGQALLVQRRAKEAAGLLERVVASRPDYVDGHYNLGVALAQLGALADAQAQFEATLRLDPAHAQAQENLRIMRQAGQSSTPDGFGLADGSS